jgi:hypothetical protein
LLLFLFWLFNPSGPALRAGTGPQRWVAEDRRAEDREETSSRHIELKTPVNIAISLETKADELVEIFAFYSLYN